VVTGWSVLAAGAGDVSGLYPEPLPAPEGHALTDFNVRALLGRKGTGSFDRVTALAVVCCGEAMRAAGVAVDDTTRTRIGVALGTSLGSFKSTSDFTGETLTQDKPYLVNPLLFPNTVMNCAAGQVAIRYGLKGVNATIAGGDLAFLNAVRYAANAIDRGYADAVFTGSVEEFSPHRAWSSHATGATAAVGSGEGAGMFLLTGEQAPAWAGDQRAARILSVATGFGPDGGELADQALTGCVVRALRQAGVEAREVTTVFTGERQESDTSEYGPVVRALGHEPRRVLTKQHYGECDAASGALALGHLLAEGFQDEGLSLLTARGPDGAVGAAVVGRCDDDGGADRR
jgi:3-oxoacyl-[acyl-carrier-protein] synthase II